MSDDGFGDPFLIVKPDESNRKMSSYLKKQGGPTTNNKCPETSSHGTSSTRSTTTSTVAENNKIGNSESGSDAFANFSNSNSSNGGSGAIEFGSDFGNGLEFGRGDALDASVGRGGSSSGGGGRSRKERRDRKKPSSRRPVSHGSNHSNSNDDGFGSADAFANTSNHNSGSNDGFTEAFGSNSFKDDIDEGFGSLASKKGNHSGNEDGFFGSADGFANNSHHSGLSNEDGFSIDAFSNSSLNNSKQSKDGFTDFAGNSHSNHGSSSDLFGQMEQFPTFGNEREEPINFGGDAFGEGEQAWKKRENWKTTARTDSTSSKDSSGERRHRSHQRDKRGDRPGPRRRHSNDPYSDEPDPTGAKSSRQVSSDRPRRHATRDVSSNDQSGSGGRSHKDRERSPPRRNLSSRQRRGATINNSDKSDTHRSGAPRSRRRQSLAGATKSDSSMEQAASRPRPKATPRKNKSMDWRNFDDVEPPSIRQPDTGNRVRARRRASCGTGFVDPMTLNVPKPSEEDDKSKQWVRDRSRNQQMILDLYKGGGGMTKTDPKESSMSQLEIDFVPPPDAALEASGDMNETSFSRGLGKLFGKKGGDKFGSLNDIDPEGVATEKPKSMLSLKGLGSKKSKSSSESQSASKKSPYAGHRDLDSRKRTTLLERVGGDTSANPASSASKNKGGLSYSDKIMEAQAKK